MPHRNKNYKLAIMEKRTKKSRLAEIPAWAMSLLTLIILIVLVFILKLFQLLEYDAFQIGLYIFYVMFLPIACFIICKTHPNSVWYTPVICNAVFLLVAIFYPYTNPDTSILIIMGSVFVLSVVGAIVGARIGRRRINQAK